MAVISLARRFGGDGGGVSDLRAPQVRRFNPSRLLAATSDTTDRVAVRRHVVGDTAPTAHLLECRGGDLADRRDLTDECERLGIERVADPKLFRLGGTDWMTFNTGSPTGSNELFVRSLDQAEAGPIRCDFPDREPIEKNWQFVERGGELVALYSVEPLVLLAAPLPEQEDVSAQFRLVSGRPAHSGRSGWRRRLPHRSLSIGTPLLHAGGDRYRLVVHEKLHVGGKRLYVGRAAELDLAGEPSLELGRDRLIWSAWMLLGTWPRLNPNLLSCTYFSGISGDPDAPTLSVGINDARLGFVRCPWEEIFR